MPRFRISLWDVNGYLKEDDLLNATDMKVDHELNGPHTLNFSYPMRDALWDTITFRKVVRLEDTFADSPSSTATVVNATNKTITLDSVTGLAVNNYVIVYDANPPSQSFVAKITQIASQTITLSRYDFTPATGMSGDGAEVRKINWTTFRVARVNQVNQQGKMFVEVECNHIGYDLADMGYLIDGRGDFSWGIRGSGAVQGEVIGISSLLTSILGRHIDASGNPLDIAKFFPGSSNNVYTELDYSDGTITLVEGDVDVSGSGTTFATSHVNGVMYVENDPHRYFVTGWGSGIAIRINKGAKTAGSGLQYMITQDKREISFSDDTLRSALIKLAETWTDHDQVTWFTVNEDKSVDVTTKRTLASSHTDSDDPTSNTTVEYEFNSESIEREYSPEDFANVIRPQGAGSDWINAYTGVSTTAANPGTPSRKRITLSADEGRKFRWGDPIYILRNPTTFTVASATQLTVTATGAPGWEFNVYAGGLAVVQSGAGNGQIRAVGSNTANTLTLERRWDIFPLGATVLVAQKIAMTQVRGFGHEKYSASAWNFGGGAGSDYLQVDDLTSIAFSDGDYAGGLLQLIGGTGESFVATILYNQTGTFGGSGTNNDVRFYIDGTLPTVDATTRFDVIGLSQIVRQLEIGFLQSRVSDTVFTIKALGGSFNQSASIEQLEWVADQWNSGWVYFTNGVGKDQVFPITDTRWDGLNWEITISGTLPAIDATTACVFVRSTNLPMDIQGSPFGVDTGDEVVLLIKETGGALTVGKHPIGRTTVDGSFGGAPGTIDTVRVEDSSKFKVNQTVFIGSKTITSAILFGIRRGDQVQGQNLKITEIVSGVDRLTFDGNLNPIPIPGDHVEIVTLADTSSIGSYGVRERRFEVDTNDPVELRRQAEIFKDAVSTPRPTYRIDFAHRYEIDPTTFDDFSLGDTVRVIDSEIGIDDSTLRIVKESYDPLHPSDIAVEVAPTELRRISTIDQRIAFGTASSSVGYGLGTKGRHDVIEHHRRERQRLLEEKRAKAPACAYWDEEGKRCRRTNYPNTYCNSEESNKDGRHTAQLTRITGTAADCLAFTPLRLHSRGNQVDGVNSDVYGSRVETGLHDFEASSAGVTKYYGSAFGVDFVVTQVHVSLEEVEDTVSPAYAADYGNTSVTVKTTPGTGEVTNNHGIVVSADPSDFNNGHGFTVTAQAPVGKTYRVYIRWLAWGYDE